MADLVISQSDLETLRDALRGALITNLPAMQHTMGSLDESCVGAAPLQQAEQAFAVARWADLTDLGRALDALANHADEVAQEMARADKDLGDRARNHPRRPR